MGAAVIGLVLKARSSFASDNRKIAHDEHTSKMEDDLRAQNVELRAQREASWKQHALDAARISQLETELSYVQKEAAELRSMIGQLREEIERMKKEHP